MRRVHRLRRRQEQLPGYWYNDVRYPGRAACHVCGKELDFSEDGDADCCGFYFSREPQVFRIFVSQQETPADKEDLGE